VGAWAGHSVQILLRIYYSQCIDGQDEAARRRIAGALAHPSRSALADEVDQAEDEDQTDDEDQTLAHRPT
jgi:hypothetical protein